MPGCLEASRTKGWHSPKRFGGKLEDTVWLSGLGESWRWSDLSVPLPGTGVKSAGKYHLPGPNDKGYHCACLVSFSNEQRLNWWNVSLEALQRSLRPVLINLQRAHESPEESYWNAGSDALVWGGVRASAFLTSPWWHSWPGECQCFFNCKIVGLSK